MFLFLTEMRKPAGGAGYRRKIESSAWNIFNLKHYWTSQWKYQVGHYRFGVSEGVRAGGVHMGIISTWFF